MLYAWAESLWREMQLGNENLDHLVTYKTLWSSRACLALASPRCVRRGHSSQVVQRLGGKTIPWADNSKAVWQVFSRPRDGEESSQIRAGAAGRGRIRFSTTLWPTARSHNQLSRQLCTQVLCLTTLRKAVSTWGEKIKRNNPLGMRIDWGWELQGGNQMLWRICGFSPNNSSAPMFDFGIRKGVVGVVFCRWCQHGKL